MRVEAIAATVLKFVGHLALATYGIVALCFLPYIPLQIFLSGRDRFFDYVVFGPTFALPIILGLLLGYRFGRRLPPLASRLLWVLPLLLLADELYLGYKFPYPANNVWTHLWDNYFGTNCGDSECMGELLLTAPLLAALAYTLGAELGRLRTRKSRIIEPA